MYDKFIIREYFEIDFSRGFSEFDFFFYIPKLIHNLLFILNLLINLTVVDQSQSYIIILKHYEITDYEYFSCSLKLMPLSIGIN